MDTMRERFTATVTDLLDHDDRVALVTADIGVGDFVINGAARRHPDRVINVGIREQLMAGVGAGLALAGFRPIIHSYAPFVVERPFEQLKLDFSHQDAAAVVVSVGASYDASASGRTHQAPGDVALISTLPGWDIYVPGHPDEVETVLRRAVAGSERAYLRLSSRHNRMPVPDASDGLVVVRPSPRGNPVVIAVGPLLDNVMAATAGLDVAVAYTNRVRPLDVAALRRVADTDLIIAEPYLAGTSAHEITAGLADRPLRLTSLGVARAELRKYGSPAEHEAAWGLDAAGLRRSIGAALQRAAGPCYSAV